MAEACGIARLKSRFPSSAKAIACFAANVLVYRRALESFKVSVAYPIMVSTGLLLVTLAAVAIPALNERVGPVQIIGMVLTAAGVWLVARS